MRMSFKLLFLFLLIPSYLFSCDCGEISTLDNFEDHELVITAEVLEIKKIRNEKNKKFK